MLNLPESMSNAIIITSLNNGNKVPRTGSGFGPLIPLVSKNLKFHVKYLK